MSNTNNKNITHQDLVEDVFKKAMQEQAAKDKNRFDYASVEVVGIPHPSKDRPAFIRLIGAPPNYSGRTATDAKIIRTARILDDSSTTMFVQYSDDRDWIMNRIVAAVLKARYEEDPATGRKVPVYLNKERHPEIVAMVLTNGTSNVFDKGWAAPKFWISNAVDYSDDWCRTNKKCKVIAKACNTVQKDGETRTYVTYGLPWTTYDTIIDTALDGIRRNKDIAPGLMHETHWSNCLLAIQRLSKDPWYRIDNAVYSRMNYLEYGDIIPKEIKDLPEEELQYERVDLDAMFRVTPYGIILKRLKGKIKMIDDALGTKFYPELKRLAAEEREEYFSKQEKEDGSYDVVDYGTGSFDEDTPLLSRDKILSAAREIAPYVDILSEAEQSYIGGVDADGIVWKNIQPVADIPVCGNPECGEQVPDEISKCPYCGKVY